MRFYHSLVFLTAGLCLSVASPALGGKEDPPPQDACECPTSQAYVNYDCADWIVNGNVMPDNPGRCSTGPCSNPQTCQWTFDMTASCDGCGVINLYVNGIIRTSSGSPFDILPRTLNKACGDGEIWTLGNSSAGACAEVIMHCDACQQG